MKRFLFLGLVLFSALVFAQTKMTAEQVLKSKDPAVMESFMKNNPNDPLIPVIKQRYLVYSKVTVQTNAPAAPSKPNLPVAKTSNAPAQNNSKTATPAKPIATSSKQEQTAQILNHMFSNDPSSKDAYVQIVNKSKCVLSVKIIGKKSYTLGVPAFGQNYILIDKGTYNISSLVCDAKYSSTKSINKDVTITLGVSNQ